ncbi:MAG: hypothetical protein ABTQ34_08865 [Bdellovibrionales bacterium]
MQRLKNALEALDEALYVLDDQVGIDRGSRQENFKKHMELLKQVRAREANILAVAQKVASRLDQTIEHVEGILSQRAS